MGWEEDLEPSGVSFVEIEELRDELEALRDEIENLRKRLEEVTDD